MKNMKKSLVVWVVSALMGPAWAALPASNKPQEKAAAAIDHPGETMQITIMVPKDKDLYQRMINDENFKGAAALPFVRKRVSVPRSDDLERASAEAASREMPTLNGPTIEYFKIKNQTAYVLLNIDRDGWAGVSFSLAKVHPLVEKTLLRFPGIKQVVWGEAPEC